MPMYHLYGQSGLSSIDAEAILPDDQAAMRHAFDLLNGGARIDVWEGTRHIAQLWGEAAGSFAGEPQARPSFLHSLPA